MPGIRIQMLFILYSGGFSGHLLPTSVTPDVYYQQLLAASQLQQQQMLLTTVNQCCQLLWLQQREMVALRTAVQAVSIIAVWKFVPFSVCFL
jgi:hypothetical protein